jgi:hypothetical protein
MSQAINPARPMTENRRNWKTTKLRRGSFLKESTSSFEYRIMPELFK